MFLTPLHVACVFNSSLLLLEYSSVVDFNKGGQSLAVGLQMQSCLYHRFCKAFSEFDHESSRLFVR